MILSHPSVLSMLNAIYQIINPIVLPFDPLNQSLVNFCVDQMIQLLLNFDAQQMYVGMRHCLYPTIWQFYRMNQLQHDR